MAAQAPPPEATRVPAVKLYSLPVIAEARGSLSYGQYDDHLAFLPRRYFVVFDVPEGQARGGHAHRSAHQFLVCVKGSCLASIDDGRNRDEILLDGPAFGLSIPPRVWSTQRRFSRDAVLLVLSSDVYDPDEYIRSYDEFMEIASKE